MRTRWYCFYGLGVSALIGCGTPPPVSPACSPGTVDADRNSENGCECTFVSNDDEPDPAYIDANCDGFDGMVQDAVFVSSTAGNDALAGTPQAPLFTINAGIQLAKKQGKHAVYVSRGRYNDSPTEPNVSLEDGISLYGGYNSERGWTRDASNVVTIVGTVRYNTGGGISSFNNKTVQGKNILHRTVLGDLTLLGPPGGPPDSGGSSYGMYCDRCPGLELVRVSILAGDGADGAPGMKGADGAKGNNGEPGGLGGDMLCQTFPMAADGHGGLGGGVHEGFPWAGGTGGNGTVTPLGENGQSGNCTLNGNGTPLCTANGGGGGTLFTPGGGGRNQSITGFLGEDGFGGTQAQSDVDSTSREWITAKGGDGKNGGFGGGGGGGGGGALMLSRSTGSTLYRGGGGGGGGSGGGGGQGGAGGLGGGGSFGVFLLDTLSIVIKDSSIQAGLGGKGGQGGEGGMHGSKGMGGPPNSFFVSRDSNGNCTLVQAVSLFQPGMGGFGGNGADGGDGGNGAGGAGGPSFAVFVKNSTIQWLGNNQLIAGQGGGPGGSRVTQGIGEKGPGLKCNQSLGDICTN